MEKLNLVVLTDDMDLRIHVKNMAADEDIVIAGYSDFGSAGMLKIESLAPDVVVCAVKGDIGEQRFAFMRNLFLTVKTTAIILLTDSLSVDTVNTAAQAGVRQSMPLDAQPSEFCEAVRRASAIEKQRQLDTATGKRTRSRTIGFFGGKGGTGKTTLAVNTAVALAKKSKRVALIDLDLQFGDVNMMLELEPKDTIIELVQERGGINIESIRSFSMIHSSGMTVLCAPKSAEFAELVEGRHIETIIDVMRPYFEYIIADLPPSFNDVSMAAVENCDEIYLVYNSDILSLKNAKVCMTILDQLQHKEKVRIIINKNINGLIRYKDFERMFGMPVFGVVGTDDKTANISLNKGRPIVISAPRTAMARDIMAIVNKIDKQAR